VKNKLKELRKEKGVTQEKCSEDTGISRRSIVRYENGYEIGDPRYIRILAEYFGTTTDEILQANKSSDIKS